MRAIFKNLYDFNILQQDFQQMNEFRMVIQIGSVRLALMREDDLTEEISVLEGIYNEMRSCLENKDYEKYHEADYRFHEYITLMSRNEYLKYLYEAISTIWFGVSKSNSIISIDRNKGEMKVLQFHKTILESLKERNIDKCVEAEVESLTRSKSYYKN